MGSVQRTLAVALTLALGPTFLPLGCGGSGGGFGPAGPAQGDAQVPEGVALQLRTCAARHMGHLGRARHSVSFDVKLADDGQVDAVALRASTLGDEELEACMASALWALSEDDLPMRRSEGRPAGPVAPEARALLGQMQGAAAACAAAPPYCVLMLGVFGLMSLTVWIYVQPSAHPGTWTHYPPAVTTPPAVSAAPLPTTTAPPMPTTMPLVDQDLWRKCQQQHETYKKAQNEPSAFAKRMASLADQLQNNRASTQERVEFCSLLEKRIKLTQQEHKERSKYIELDCDKFDWFNTGTTAAERLADHQGALKRVDAQLKNLYDLNKLFCQ